MFLLSRLRTERTAYGEARQGGRARGWRWGVREGMRRRIRMDEEEEEEEKKRKGRGGESKAKNGK